MPEPVYDFDTQLKLGQRAERELDKLFSKWYEVREATMEQQRMGIDRWFRPPEGEEFAVEYKTDFKAKRTKRAFIETVSVEKDGEVVKQGWVHTTQADFVVYWAYGWEVLVIKPSVLRALLPRWTELYRGASSNNGEYKSRGILVPWHVFRLTNYLESRLYHTAG